MNEIQHNVSLSSQTDKIPPAYTQLFLQLDAHNISWCSWKSNEHLLEGLQGKTDIDILFYEKDRPLVTCLMHDCGFILFKTPKHRSYPGVIDTISIDIETGRLLHAHTHFLLTSGEKYLKSVILPWNDYILENRIPSEITDNIPTSTPAVEAVLLLARESLKIRTRDIRRTKQDLPWGGKGFKKELDWLTNRISADEIKDCATSLLNQESADLMHKMTTKPPSFSQFVNLRRHVQRLSQQNSWYRMGSMMARFQVWLREGLYIATRIAEKMGISQQLIIRRRTLNNDGLIIAFLGVDGSGKSTVTQTIISQWEHKIDLAHVYLGTGDGSQTLLWRITKLILLIGGTVKKLIKGHTSNQQVQRSKNKEGNNAPSLSTLLYACTSSWDKSQKIRRIQKLRNRGFIIICDRWPQNQVSGINDGPLLSAYKDHNNSLYRMLSRWEEKQFNKFCYTLQPDIAIQLSPSLDTAISRKQEHSDIKDLISAKMEAFKRIQFPQSVEHKIIDADHPIETVLKNVRDVIWLHLKNRPLTQPSIYECVGLPGAGKTTICKNIYESHNLKSIDDAFPPTHPISLLSKIYVTLLSLITMPTTYILALKLILELKLWKRKYSLKHTLRLPVQILRLKKATENTPHLIEQLFLQNLWSILITSNIHSVKPHVLASFIESLYHGISTRILYFSITPEEATLRVKNRTEGTSRFDDLPQENIKDNLINYSTLMNDILRAASYAGLEVHHIDASLSHDIVLKNAKNALRDTL